MLGVAYRLRHCLVSGARSQAWRVVPPFPQVHRQLLHAVSQQNSFSSVAGDGVTAEKQGAVGASHAQLPERPTASSKSESECAKDGSTAKVRSGPPLSSSKKVKASVDSAELAKFALIADSWWDHGGPYKPLHVMNPTRISFIRTALCSHFRKDPNCARPLEGLAILDVGCGGGLACEPLARLGGQVMGVDAGEKNIAVASLHAARDSSTSTIRYRCTTAEQLVEEGQQFDAVICLEVIEHVTDPKEFCKSLAALLKRDGILIVSTINRSIRSWGLAIMAAEYILGWLPKGTHQWTKFVTPEELALLMHYAGLQLEGLAGMVYNPLAQSWSLSEDTSVNFIVSGRHQGL